jgi:hypothetical protein
MTDNKLYDLIVKQKDFILELIKQGKINEATASYETVKDLWISGQYFSAYIQIQKKLVSLHDKRMSDAKKSFAEEVLITGR